MSVVQGAMPTLLAETEGAYAMHGPDSVKWLTDQRPLGTKGSNGTDASTFAENGKVRFESYQENEKKVQKLFGVGEARAVAIRYCGAELGMSAARELDGDTVNVDDGAFSLIVGFAAGVAAPVGVYSSGAYSMMKPDVAHGSFVVVPEMHMCDLYLEIDGKKFEDGHVCCGDGTLSKQKAIESVSGLKIYDDNIVDLIKKSLKSGPPDGSKPWATVVSGESFKNTNHVHLPLLGKDAHKASTDLSVDFCHSLMCKFASAIGSVKPGEHTFKITVRPRGVVGDGEHVTEGLDMGMRQICERSNDINEFMESFPRIHVTDPNATGASATWKMTTTAAHTKAPGREAHEFATAWPAGEINKAVKIAMSVANVGKAGGAAAKYGCGKCAHIILVGHGIEKRTFGSDAADDFFQVFGLYKSKDGKPNSVGAQIEFGCKRETKKNGYPVRNPEWENVVIGRDGITKESLTNAEIDAAIARDAHHLQAGDDDDSDSD